LFEWSELVHFGCPNFEGTSIVFFRRPPSLERAEHQFAMSLDSFT